MATEIVGVDPCNWEGDEDEKGGRVYHLRWKIKGTKRDGPANVMNTPGIFLPGAFWQLYDDIDPWAFCTRELKVTPIKASRTDGPTRFWYLDQTFKTADKQDPKKCSDMRFEDPLTEPQHVSGDFSKYTEEGLYDRFGRPIVNSAWEPFKGPQNEWDANRPKITIEQNVPELQLDILAQFINRVNSGTLWGFPARWIKLGNAPWEKKYYGQCNAYYTRKLEFDIQYGGWDRNLLDEGTKALNGHWGTAADHTNNWVVDNLPAGGVPDKNNPAHFVRVTDKKGDPMMIILDGNGKPVSIGNGTDDSTDPGNVHVEKYEEADFLLLAIPTTF